MDKKKCVYTHGILFSIKRSEILIHDTIWMNPENIVLSEVSQTQRDKYYMNPLIRGT